MNHQQRIKEELTQAGFSKYALMKSESRKLPAVIHEDEHIMGAVYGRTPVGSAVLIATDQRVIYLDIKPLFKIMDEINYDVVSGITHDEQAGFSHIILHSRVGDYKIRYANPTCAGKFREYIEQMRITLPSAVGDYARTTPSVSKAPEREQAIITQEALAFLQNHELGVIATVNRAQEPHAAAVYYTIDDGGIIHILTKTGTSKSRDIVGNHTVAFTVYDEVEMQTAQMLARAEIEPDAATRQRVYNYISRERVYGIGPSVPPIAKLHEGSFTIIRLTPLEITYHDYAQS